LAPFSKHKTAEHFREVEDDVMRGKAADALMREFEVIQDFYTSFDPLIAPYMKMHDRAPS